MNDQSDLLPLPPERDLPAASLERRRKELVDAVTADLRMSRMGRFARLRAVRIWLTSLLLLLGIAAIGGSLLSTPQLPGPGTRVMVESAVTLGSGPLIVSLALKPRTRSGGTPAPRGVVQVSLHHGSPAGPGFTTFLAS